jgi:hypothetical protein
MEGLETRVDLSRHGRVGVAVGQKRAIFDRLRQAFGLRDLARDKSTSPVSPATMRNEAPLIGGERDRAYIRPKTLMAALSNALDALVSASPEPTQVLRGNA